MLALLSLLAATPEPAKLLVLALDDHGRVAAEAREALLWALRESLDEGELLAPLPGPTPSCATPACRKEQALEAGAQLTLQLSLRRFGRSCALQAQLRDAMTDATRGVATTLASCDADGVESALDAVAHKLELAIDPPSSPPALAEASAEAPAEPVWDAGPLVAQGLELPPAQPLRCKTAQACYDRGVDYQNGTEKLARDDARAVDHFRWACARGVAAACVDLGYHQEMGRGTPVDLRNAAALYQLGCDGGDQVGCSNLAFMHENARGVPRDLAKALMLYGSACEAGNARGCSSLGYMIENGSGTEEDLPRAAALYLRGCEGGNMIGCANYAFMLAHGRGVEQDDAAAATYDGKACEGGEGRGCTDLGYLYENGRGVPFDLSRAVEHYQRACELEHALGCANLGDMLEHGRGRDADRAAARLAYRAGCELGEARACDGLARMR